MLVADVWNALCAVAVLTGQALVDGISAVAGRVDPVEVDIGRSQAEEAEADERRSHCELISRSGMVSQVKTLKIEYGVQEEHEKDMRRSEWVSERANA